MAEETNTAKKPAPIERQSALHALARGKPATSAALTLTEFRPAVIVQMQAWLSTAIDFANALSEVTELPMPDNGTFVDNAHGMLVSLGVGRLMLLSDTDGIADQLKKAIGRSGTLTDLSHGFSIVRLAGAPAASLLAHGIALDFDTLPPGGAAQTKMAAFDVLVLRQADDCFDIAVARSYGEAMVEWLVDAGKAWELTLSAK
ncbi:hypothetical protein L0F51_18510 [Afifella sp. H1R]|uniref:hypothetical protein n=1 Tax=Afifella sp. H1R TaxID=2908841 RepID=UPI001F3AEF3E|nr:hypothetical protein [Afifella sp. H1R]MCF1505752.1 hypothetical protein [Afifella sp. H1R]